MDDKEPQKKSKRGGPRPKLGDTKITPTEGPGAGRPRIYARLDVWAELQKMNYNPLAELVKTANDPSTDIKLKSRIDEELLGYCAPKLKSVEHKAEEGSPMEDLMRLVADQGRPKPPETK